jgi:hypothetical protein
MNDTVSSGVTPSNISVTNGEVWSIYGAADSFTVGNGGQDIVYSGGVVLQYQRHFRHDAPPLADNHWL